LSANTRTALKAFIEALGFAGLAAFQDEAAQGAVRPYVVIIGPIGFTPGPMEDGGTLLAIGGAQAAAARPVGSPQTVKELMQVDLWQTWRNPPAPDPQHVVGPADHALLEDASLPEKLYAALHGARLPTAPQLVYACVGRGMQRLFERETNLVHHALTVEVNRLMSG
jgi:hypothetical protein